MFLIDAIKPNIEKKFKTHLFFTQLFMGVESGAYKIATNFFCVWFVGGNKNIIKKKQKEVYNIYLGRA